MTHIEFEIVPNVARLHVNRFWHKLSQTVFHFGQVRILLIGCWLTTCSESFDWKYGNKGSLFAFKSPGKIFLPHGHFGVILAPISHHLDLEAMLDNQLTIVLAIAIVNCDAEEAILAGEVKVLGHLNVHWNKSARKTNLFGEVQVDHELGIIHYWVRWRNINHLSAPQLTLTPHIVDVLRFDGHNLRLEMIGESGEEVRPFAGMVKTLWQI